MRFRPEIMLGKKRLIRKTVSQGQQVVHLQPADSPGLLGESIEVLPRVVRCSRREGLHLGLEVLHGILFRSFVREKFRRQLRTIPIRPFTEERERSIADTPLGEDGGSSAQWP